MDDLGGKVAVVTGAASGIGRGAALAMARRGVQVVVADRDLDGAQRVADELRELGTRAEAVGCDVTSLSDLEAARDVGLGEFGQLDIVMNNVGTLAIGRPEDIPLDEWELTIDVNLLGIVRGLKAFLPHLLDQGHGHVVNTASTAGLFPYAWDRLPYTTTKAAVVMLSANLARYLHPKGIGVTCFCPGPVSTNIGSSIRFHGDHTDISSPPLPMVTGDEAGEGLVRAIEAGAMFAGTTPEIADITGAWHDDLIGYLGS